MNITEVQIEFVKPNNGLIGFASLIINNDLYLSSIAIHSKLNDEGYRITYPTKELFNNKSVNLFHPINKESSSQIEQAILNKLKEVMNKVNNDRYNSHNVGKKPI
jgi:stage V sporulation protein G